MSRLKILVTLGVVLIAAMAGWLYWFLAFHGFSAREAPSALKAFLADPKKHKGKPLPAPCRN